MMTGPLESQTNMEFSLTTLKDLYKQHGRWSDAKILGGSAPVFEKLLNAIIRSWSELATFRAILIADISVTSK